MPRQQHSKPGQPLCAMPATAAVLAITIGLSIVSQVTSAREGKESFDPFSQLSQRNWVSPDKFEKTMPPPQEPESPPNDPAMQKPVTVGNDAPGQSPPSTQPEQTPPQKVGYGMEINSTAENMKLPVPMPPAKTGEQPPRRYEPGWMESAAIARRQAFAESSKGWSPYGSSTPAPSSLRLSYLPGKIPPLTPPSNVPAPPAQPAKSAKPNARAPDNAEAQAPDLETWTKAIKDYKTKQMEAIQSDRQTLEALQNAIKELGLQQELNFDSSLLLSPTKQETPPSISKDGAQRNP